MDSTPRRCTHWIVWMTGMIGCTGPETAPRDAATGMDAPEAADAGDPRDAGPLVPPALTWTWVPIEGAQCMDGTPAGIYVNPNAASDRLLIVLTGGADCVDAASCAGVGEVAHPLRTFDRAMIGRDPENPLRMWNLVFVPYCTGDLHLGDAPDTTVPFASGPQQFVGARNVGLFSTWIASFFAEVRHVVLAGTSSGGAGALANFPQVQRAFGDVPVSLLDDSGPPIPPGDPGGYHQALLDHWGAERTLGAECGAACPDPSRLFVDYFAWLVSAYPSSTFALAAYTNDTVWPPALRISGAEWLDHVTAMRVVLTDAPSSTASFFIAEPEHVFATPANFSTATAAGVDYPTWLGAVLGTPSEPVHLGP